MDLIRFFHTEYFDCDTQREINVKKLRQRKKSQGVEGESDTVKDNIRKTTGKGITDGVSKAVIIKLEYTLESCLGEF